MCIYKVVKLGFFRKKTEQTKPKTHEDFVGLLTDFMPFGNAVVFGSCGGQDEDFLNWLICMWICKLGWELSK